MTMIKGLEMQEKDIIHDDADIQVGPFKIKNIEELKIGEKLPSSKLEEVIFYIGKDKVKTLEKSFYSAKNIDEYFLNIYKIEECNLVNESSNLISEKKYNKYLNWAKQNIN
jgi:hypothetical protein